jgi:hypothetical protein
MTAEVFVRRTRIQAPVGEAFRWHARPGALERLTAPWESVELVERTGEIEDGARVVLRVRAGPVQRRCVAEHRDCREFTKTLGRVLGRPTLFPPPAFTLRLAFGEVADELLLASQRVEPARLLASGYSFRFPDPEGALRHLLGK